MADDQINTFLAPVYTNLDYVFLKEDFERCRGSFTPIPDYWVSKDVQLNVLKRRESNHSNLNSDGYLTIDIQPDIDARQTFQF